MSLVPVAEHQAAVASLLASSSRPPRPVPIVEAVGRVLASAVLAPEALPAFANSAMDGYAVRAADVASASPSNPVVLPVAGDIPAGAARSVLAPGTALRIMTGAPVPEGADAIVEIEVTDGGTTSVSILEPRESGRFIRAAGSDVRAGAEVLAAGTVIGPAQVGLLAALGITSVSCVHRPRVLVLSTGSELADSPAAGSGQIRDANGPMLCAAVVEAGAIAVRAPSSADDVASFLASLDAHLDGIDLVLTSGGVSMGAYEVVKDAFGPRGVTFTKVAMQPGMPQGLGTYAGVPVVCLPGNPVSSLVSFEVFVRPALRALAGLPAVRPVVAATLTTPLTSPAGKRQLRRGRLDRVAASVEAWGPAGSGFLGWAAGADCLIDVPAEVSELPAGAPVDVWDLTLG
ncbi:molybdopterin molybdotransferase MoeA [Nocardioides montaniterrae]